MLFIHSQAMAFTSWSKIAVLVPACITSRIKKEEEKKYPFPMRVLSENYIQCFYLISISHAVFQGSHEKGSQAAESWGVNTRNETTTTTTKKMKTEKWKVFLESLLFKEIRESEAIDIGICFIFTLGEVYMYKMLEISHQKKKKKTWIS